MSEVSFYLHYHSNTAAFMVCFYVGVFFFFLLQQLEALKWLAALVLTLVINAHQNNFQ